MRLSDPYLTEFFGLKAAGAVTPENVLSNSAVAVRCVALRSELLASVGLHLYRRAADGGRSRADDVPLYDVLHSIASERASSYEFREFMIRSLDLTGNAFAVIERDRRGQVTALYALMPIMVGVQRLASGRLRYKVTDPAGGTRVYLQDEILHIRGPSRDGVMGLSPIAIARGALSLAMSQHETASALVLNSLNPSAIITFPEKLSPASREQAIASVANRLQGAANAGRFVVMDGGPKFERMAFSPEDAQFLESTKFSAENVCRIFGVPPTAAGILDRGTYSNTEQEAQSLV
ncbi:MAG: phage portal protein, partial [Proteobacteria bacterium]|nr:phage portal protein [Pseudomonadota bacterium]